MTKVKHIISDKEFEVKKQNRCVVSCYDLDSNGKRINDGITSKGTKAYKVSIINVKNLIEIKEEI